MGVDQIRRILRAIPLDTPAGHDLGALTHAALTASCLRAAGIGEDEAAIRRLVNALATTIARLPAQPPVSLPKLAHDCAGDPHYFDLNTLNGVRLVAAVAELTDRPEPRRPDRVCALLAHAGIIADRLSATVLMHQLAADQGVALRYAGDLDPDGVHVAAYIAEHYGAELVTMDAETISAAGPTPSAVPLMDTS